MSAVGKAGETEGVALHFDGSGHIGDLQFDGAGSLATRGADGQVLTEFTSASRCNVAELVKKSQNRKTLRNETLQISGKGYKASGQNLVVNSRYGSGEVSFSIRCDGDYREGVDDRGNPYDYGGHRRFMEVRIMLEVRQGFFVDYANVYTFVTKANSDSYSGSFKMSNLPVGTYRLSVNFDNGIFRNTATDVYFSDFHYTEGLIKPFNAIAGDGIMSFYSSEQYTFIQEGKLHIKGKHDMPGLLASGRVGADGHPSSLWGLATNVNRRSTGEYLIYHNIGHTDYSIIISPIGNGHLMQGQLAAQTGDVAWCYIKDVQDGCRMVNTPFTFAIIGRN